MCYSFVHAVVALVELLVESLPPLSWVDRVEKFEGVVVVASKEVASVVEVCYSPHSRDAYVEWSTSTMVNHISTVFDPPVQLKTEEEPVHPLVPSKPIALVLQPTALVPISSRSPISLSTPCSVSVLSSTALAPPVTHVRPCRALRVHQELLAIRPPPRSHARQLAAVS